MALKKKQKLMIEALKNQLGNVTASINSVGISRQTHYDWLKDKEYKEAVEEAEYALKDFGEHCLFKLMKEGNPAAIIFFNKCKNKDRGYVERTELEHSGDKGIKIIIKEDDRNTINQETDESSEATE